MKFKTKVFVTSIGCLFILAFVFRNLIGSLYFIGLSHLTPPDLDYVKEKTWSYDSGFRIGEGDFVSFKDSNLFRLQYDTIYYKGSPKATVKTVNKHFYQMTVTSITGKQAGSYTNIEEFTH